MARPKNRVRPNIVLTQAYISKIGSQCGQLHEVVDKAAGRAVDEITRRELAIAAETLAKMRDMFL